MLNEPIKKEPASAGEVEPAEAKRGLRLVEVPAVPAGKKPRDPRNSFGCELSNDPAYMMEPVEVGLEGEDSTHTCTPPSYVPPKKQGKGLWGFICSRMFRNKGTFRTL